jgi:Glycine cleavage H-protein
VLPELRYATSHEYAKPAGDVVVIGVSDHAQAELGDVVYVELPEVGATFAKGDTFGVVESVKVSALAAVSAAAARDASHSHGHTHSASGDCCSPAALPVVSVPRCVLRAAHRPAGRPAGQQSACDVTVLCPCVRTS